MNERNERSKETLMFLQKIFLARKGKTQVQNTFVKNPQKKKRKKTQKTQKNANFGRGKKRKKTQKTQLAFFSPPWQQSQATH